MFIVCGTLLVHDRNSRTIRRTEEVFCRTGKIPAAAPASSLHGIFRYSQKTKACTVMGELAARELLLVEDNPADVYLIQKALAECGNEIHLSVVPNGREALAFLRKDPPFARAPSPALILLDLNLPKIHGKEVLAELRRLPTYLVTPIVVFSAADKDVEEQHCLQLGANAYVQKPSDFYAFFATIHAIVRQWLM